MDKKGKIKKVLEEWKKGDLETSAGKKVKDRKQALAIALSEAKEYANGGFEDLDTQEAEENSRLNYLKARMLELQNQPQTDEIRKKRQELKESIISGDYNKQKDEPLRGYREPIEAPDYEEKENKIDKDSLESEYINKIKNLHKTEENTPERFDKSLKIRKEFEDKLNEEDKKDDFFYKIRKYLGM